jgi:DNA-binding transcriptional regulator YiaG
MRDTLFAELQEAVRDVAAYRRGERRGLRVSRFVATPKPLKPVEIRRIRKQLGISQPMFAKYLGTSVGCVRSWEQGSRRPQSTALRLLCLARKNPAILLETEA